MRLRDKARPMAPPMEAGVYFAVCTIIADVGDQYNENFKNTNRKLVLGFDIPSETIEVDGELKPRQLSRWFTFAYSKKSNLFKVLSSWIGVTNEDALADYDLYELAGQGCQVQVAINDKGRNIINALMALPRGVPAPVSSNPVITYDIDEDGFDGPRWDALPEWIKNAVMKSEQYKDRGEDKPLDMPEDVTTPAVPAPTVEAQKKVCPF